MLFLFNVLSLDSPTSSWNVVSWDVIKTDECMWLQKSLTRGLWLCSLKEAGPEAGKVWLEVDGKVLSEWPLEQVPVPPRTWSLKQAYTSALGLVLPAHLINHSSHWFPKETVLCWIGFPCPADVVKNEPIFLFENTRLSELQERKLMEMNNVCKQQKNFHPNLTDYREAGPVSPLTRCLAAGYSTKSKH